MRRLIVEHAGRYERIGANFHRGRVLLFLEALGAEERFNDLVVDDAAQFGILDAFARNEVDRFKLEPNFSAAGSSVSACS